MKYHIILIFLGVMWSGCGGLNQNALQAQDETQAILETLEDRGYLIPNEVDFQTREIIQDRIFLIMENQATAAVTN